LNEERFTQFINARIQNGDWSRYISADRSSLSRKRIIEVCQFSRSSFYQNSTIKKRLFEMENQLREAGQLVSLHRPTQVISVEESSLDDEVENLQWRLDTLQVQRAELLESMEEARRYIRSLSEG
jgi:hypothetical protein